MFGKLKEKLKKVTASISKKFKEKEPIVEEVPEEILPKEEFKAPEIEEEVKAIVEEEIPQNEELKAPTEEPVEEKPFEEVEAPVGEVIKTEEVIEEEVPPKEEFKAPAIEEKPGPVTEETEKPEILIEPGVEKKGGLIKKLKERVVERILGKKVVEEPKPEIPIEKIRPEIERPGEERIVKRIKEKVVKKVFTKKLSENDLGPILSELETGLIEADVAYEVAEKIKNDLKKSLVDRSIRRGKEEEVVVDAMKQSLIEILSVPEINLENIIKKTKKDGRPAVFIFLGFNGVGKSLSLSKTAKWLKNKNYKPLLAAGDTFRAAGIDQLEEYGKKVGAPVIKQTYGSDSCAVIFDARKAAEARGFDVVLADTAGRSHVDTNLMAELQKICRVNKPDLKILVLDSLSGSDVLAQFEFFDKAVGVDAVIFSKVDVNEKGGNILSVCHNFKKPILFLGMGQGYGQLEVYNPERFINRLILS